MSQSKYEWFGAFRYVKPEMFEQWLEGLARNGWAPSRVGQWSSILMRITKSKTKNYRYFFDAQMKKRPDYVPAHEEFGWEYLGQMASSHLWRKAYRADEPRPEAFSDHKSQKDREMRFIAAVIISGSIFFVAGLFMLGFGLLSNLPRSEAVQLVVAGSMSGLAAVAHAYIVFKILK
jgi:hypothetical protein